MNLYFLCVLVSNLDSTARDSLSLQQRARIAYNEPQPVVNVSVKINLSRTGES